MAAVLVRAEHRRLLDRLEVLLKNLRRAVRPAAVRIELRLIELDPIRPHHPIASLYLVGSGPDAPSRLCGPGAWSEVGIAAHAHPGSYGQLHTVILYES